MKRIMTLMLAAGIVFGAATGASAIDFKAKGQWIFGFGAVNGAFVTKDSGGRTSADTADKFGAVQRLRLQMDAVASETLSGTVFFEIGDQNWGRARQGAALGADGMIVEVKHAYLDWMVPSTDLKLRMGIQAIEFPHAAGGPSIVSDDMAAVVANYRFNENVGLTAMWLRPYNDNYTRNVAEGYRDPNNFLDNVDMFGLTLPITAEGWKITPWVVAGFAGKNNLRADAPQVKSGYTLGANNLLVGTLPFNYTGVGQRFSNAYSTMVWAGLPIVFNGLDPWNFELDLNYGYSEGYGKFDAPNLKNGYISRGDTKRQGWLAKALVEYKMDWGTPGLFAWYASGDDSNVKNGSERMPSISPAGNFTSFLGDGDLGWSFPVYGYDLMLSYAGTWGIGGRIKNMSFMENLKHTFTVAYWGGTNSPSMVKYLGSSAATARIDNGAWVAEGLYLTSNDGLLEFNLDSSYKIYENLTMIVQLGYIVNMIDKGTWEHAYNGGNFTKGDAYKAALIFNYSF